MPKPAMPHATHTASLPYCYYDKYDQKIVLQVRASSSVSAVSVIHGDPFDFVKEGSGAYTWQYAEKPLRKQYEAAGLPGLWQIALAVPKHRRLKYAFRIVNTGGEYYFSENGIWDWGAVSINSPHNYFFFPFIHEVDAPSAPAWAQRTVWYQIFPERFCKGNPAISPAGAADWEHDEPSSSTFFGGDLYGIRQKLGYIKDLGVSGIFLNPIFQAPSSHKYDTGDYLLIDEHFGDLQEFKSLVTEAHSLGIRVMLDAVFNHIGMQHRFWQDVLKNQEKSAYKDYFHIHRFPVRDTYDDVRNMDFDTFAYGPRMPKWNTENPGARKYLLDVAEYWIREGDIDGWRLDVANEVSFDFWQEFGKRVRGIKSDFYVVGEVWHDASNWINPGYFDAVMNYPLGAPIIDFFLRKQINAEQFTERLFKALARYSPLHRRIAFNLLDSHDTARALTIANGDKQALRNAFTLLLPGSPSIYYGTEVGMDGGDDPLCRKPMVWDEANRELLSFFRETIAFRNAHIDLINNGSFQYRAENGVHCWKISNENEAIVIEYRHGRAVTYRKG
jgi:neopullulanase